jgi:ring-1,2-phenylacetyl-CoA epoxidase subunit PaaC
VSDFETQALHEGVGVDTRQLKADWDSLVQHALAEATLQLPSTEGFVTTGKQRVHSEHLSFMLNEMQSLARAHPQGVW